MSQRVGRGEWDQRTHRLNCLCSFCESVPANKMGLFLAPVQTKTLNGIMIFARAI